MLIIYILTSLIILCQYAKQPVTNLLHKNIMENRPLNHKI